MSEDLEKFLKRIPRREDVPEPQPGHVVRYDYHWRDKTEPKYDRPCVIVAIDERTNPHTVLLAPISTNPPRNPTTSREVQDKAARRLHLTASRSWMRTDEYNVERNWPNNVRKIPDGERVGHTLYGAVSKRTLEIIQKDLNRNMAKGRTNVVERTRDDRVAAAQQRAKQRMKPDNGNGDDGNSR